MQSCAVRPKPWCFHHDAYGQMPRLAAIPLRWPRSSGAINGPREKTPGGWPFVPVPLDCVWTALLVTDSWPCEIGLLLSSVILDRQTLTSCCSASPLRTSEQKDKASWNLADYSIASQVQMGLDCAQAVVYLISVSTSFPIMPKCRCSHIINFENNLILAVIPVNENYYHLTEQVNWYATWCIINLRTSSDSMSHEAGSGFHELLAREA
ncbi:hypothetical protein INT43_006359 [Umbelopsis isabellina]|uniref:Uncharacterized protein n=1 Tax=Mortierella isabellina TaxID=91625 RepID=A0A8H7ULN0_MORIS|nr:hypothetical protein INT43_006359 [Umbelopsis isabellina]